jgi:hypothetical protein
MRLYLALALLPLGLAAPQRRELAPLLKALDPSEVIADRFIVKFYDDISMSEDAKSLYASVDYVYDGEFRGFAGPLDAEAVKALRADPRV